MSKKRVAFKSGGYELVGIKSLPERLPAPGVVLFHGLTNSKEDCPLIMETAEALEAEGFATFRFDFYGSGESPGTLKDKTLSILYQNSIDAINYFYNPKEISCLGLWGRSFGAISVILCGVNDPRVKACVIASGSVLLEKAFFGGAYQYVKSKESELAKIGKRLPGTGHYKGKFDLNPILIEEASEFQKKMLEKLKYLSHVLVLATTPDKKVSLENSTTIINTVKEPKMLFIFEDTDHGYEGKYMEYKNGESLIINVKEKAIQLEIEWFRKYLMFNKPGGVKYE